MDIVVVGHVDHGKSTVVGRLMADTNSLPEGKLEQVRATCEKNSKPFEYAFLLDTLKDEQSQGITIDAARIFFKTNLRPYTIIDAPGHIEFLKNMVTGASRAEAALLVIDGKEGVQENSRRHGYILSLLGVKQIAVLVNKMDLLNYDQKLFEAVKTEYKQFLEKLEVRSVNFIPVAGFHGDNIVQKSAKMKWYDGPSVIEMLDSFKAEESLVQKPFRMPVQDIYKFTRAGDDRRIVAGTIDCGKVKIGDEVVFYPSGKKSKVKSIEAFNIPVKKQAVAKEATGFTLIDQIFIVRGEIATIKGEPAPQVGSRLKVNLFWLGKEPMVKMRTYGLKLGTARVEVRLTEVLRTMNTSNMETMVDADKIEANSAAECILTADQAIAIDPYSEIQNTGRFVIIDRFDISGGGLVREALADEQAGVRSQVILRNTKWDMSIISAEQRAERLSQRAALIIVTSAKTLERKGVAKKLEKDLFDSGRLVYFLGMGNSLYGVSADILNRDGGGFDEAVRRFGEQINVLMDAGVIVVASIAEMTQDHLEIIKATVGANRIFTIWYGDSVTTNLVYDLKSTADTENEAVRQIKANLQNRGLIFKP